MSGMRAPRVVRVYQPHDQHSGPDKVFYRQAIAGWPIDRAELVDPPASEADQRWIREVLMTRIAPGGIITSSQAQDHGTEGTWAAGLEDVAAFLGILPGVKPTPEAIKAEQAEHLRRFYA